MTFAMYMLTHLGPDTSRLTSGIYFAILGIGMGFLMQITTLIVQNSVEPKDMGVASSSRTFFQQIGGSIGVSLFGVIFTRRLAESLRAQLPGVHLHTSSGQLDPATINQLPALIRHAAFVGISHGIDGVFIWAVPTAALVFVLAWLIKEIPLRGRSEHAGGARRLVRAGVRRPAQPGDSDALKLVLCEGPHHQHPLTCHQQQFRSFSTAQTAQGQWPPTGGHCP